MPLLSLRTSRAAVAEPLALQQELSSTLAALLAKPERYVMTLLEWAVPMTFGGDPAPACYVEVKSIGGLDADRTRRISADLGALIARHLDLPLDRIYIGFEDVRPQLWGWNGGTFG